MADENLGEKLDKNLEEKIKLSLIKKASIAIPFVGEYIFYEKQKYDSFIMGSIRSIGAVTGINGIYDKNLACIGLCCLLYLAPTVLFYKDFLGKNNKEENRG